jgi:hypothetical protein
MPVNYEIYLYFDFNCVGGLMGEYLPTDLAPPKVRKICYLQNREITAFFTYSQNYLILPNFDIL